MLPGNEWDNFLSNLQFVSAPIRKGDDGFAGPGSSARTRGRVVRVDDGVGGHTLGRLDLSPGVDGVHVGNLDVELLELADSGEHCAKGDCDQQKARQRLRGAGTTTLAPATPSSSPWPYGPMRVIRGVLVNLLEE